MFTAAAFHEHPSANKRLKAEGGREGAGVRVFSSTQDKPLLLFLALTHGRNVVRGHTTRSALTLC